MGRLHDETDALLDLLVRSGDLVVDMLDWALRSLTAERPSEAERTLQADDRVDATFAEVQDRVVAAMALPAASDADRRLLASLLTVNIHVERMGDHAVNVARAAQRSADASADPELTRQLGEMGLLATDVARQAMRGFARRDAEAARGLPALDDDVDRLNLGVFQRLGALAADEALLPWATQMILVGRYVERYGDHAVDIGEATIYAVTGRAEELSSNSPRGADPG